MPSINLAEKYLPILDAIYKKMALTAPLEINPMNVKFKNANKVELFNLTLTGMGDYSRTSGFVSGAVGNTWEDYTLTQDRGTSFTVDSMDDEETINMLFGRLVGEFFRTKVIPELDAYRFATLAGTSNITTVTADLTAGTTDITALLDTAEEVLGDNEVPNDGNILYVSELCYKALKQKGITRTIANENGVNRNIEVYNNMEVRRVPKTRFCTGITMLDGSTVGETNGGYKFTSGSSKPINFMIVNPQAVACVTKHATLRQFNPDVNQTADAYKVDYRLYHDIFVPDNKVKGIYAHIGSTAIGADITG